MGFLSGETALCKRKVQLQWGDLCMSFGCPGVVTLSVRFFWVNSQASSPAWDLFGGATKDSSVESFRLFFNLHTLLLT